METHMTEYRVKWCQCPTSQHSSRLLFVEAASPEDAKTIAKDHIERTFGISWLVIWEANETVPMPAGRVVAK
jgi:hypothetical protein